jgi:hypothetical protein
MSSVPGLFERFAEGLGRALSFAAPFGAAPGRGQASTIEDRHDVQPPPAWPDEPGLSDREQEERLRELQILMATWM